MDGAVNQRRWHEGRDGRAKKMDTVKVLLPVRSCASQKTRSSMDTTGLLGTLMYSFLTSVFWKAHRQGITEDTLARLMSDRDAAVVNCERFERLWEEEINRQGESDASLKGVIFRFMRTRFLIASGVLVLGLSSGFLLTAYVLYTAIVYLEEPGKSIGYSVALASAIFASTVCRVVGMNFMWYLTIRTAVRVRNALMLILYKKVLRLRNMSEVSVGEMVNICVNDMQRLFDATVFGPILIAFPLFVLFILAGCVLIVGIFPTLAGLVTLIVVFALQTCLAKLNVRIRQKCVVLTDRRTRLLNEVLNCIKLIKMYAWEESFAQNITEIRQRERRQLQRAGYLTSYTLGMALCVCPAVILTSAICYKLMGSDITAAEAFTLMLMFNSLSTIMYILPMALKPITESVVSIQRIQPILVMNEASLRWDVPPDPGHALVLINASFSWHAPPQSEPKPAGTEAEINTNSKYTLVVECADGSDGEGGNEERNHKQNNKVWSGEPNTTDALLGKEAPSPIQAPTLRDISLTVPKSHLIGICGAVGSGKSSLLSSVLDQMNLLGGTVELDGTFAYASQQAWIMNATVRDNILFGQPFNQDRYERAVFTCCLERDLEIMSDGDRTEIGERGVNVSGGQKQRISLARAYYSDRDIYLLDDPLSAVDAHVGKHIFTHCIHGALRGKTVLFVSHQLQYLRDCDHVVLVRDGAIAEQGTHDQLIAADGEYARLIDTFHGAGEDEEEDVNDAIPEVKHEDENKNKEESSHDKISQHEEDEAEEADEDKETTEVVKLIGDEDQGHGTVAFATYKSFVRFTGSRFWAFLVPLLMFITMLSSVVTNVWLSVWIQTATVWRNYSQLSTAGPQDSTWLPTSTPFMNYSLEDAINSTDGAFDYDDDYAPTTASVDGSNTSASDGVTFFMIIYASIFFNTYFFLIISSFLFIITILRATTRLHDSLLRKIIRCPTSFFDTTPLGRILNRFSKDMDEVDLLMPMNLQRCLFFLSCLIILQFLFIFVFPLYIIVLVIVLVIGVCLYMLFRKGYCEIKRMDNTTRSKVVSHISATMQGLTTIKAYGQGQRFTRKFEELLDTNSLIMELFFMAPRWTAARMDLLSSCLLLVLCSLILVFKASLYSAALAAMALQQAIAISGGLLQEVLVSCTQTESSFLSVERMLEYIEQSPSEADAHIEATKPADEWPEHGDLKLQKLEMRYRDNLPLILKGISCHIRPREKIGIVGRTGSGKSTLGVSLFRLVENVSGHIILDDVDVSTIGLHDLRSKLSIIPQDPVLFAGTVRFNLDPHGNHTDEELWSALEKTYVKQTISALDNQLEAPVIENGENFSVGERQLMCMSRALLRNSKVLLMDEATAAIDTETDSLIQQTIREAFKDCTMLIIAHRLNTILDCDKIMLMDSGEIAEFDKPEVLQADPNSLFSGMLAAAKHNKGSLED